MYPGIRWMITNALCDKIKNFLYVNDCWFQ